MPKQLLINLPVNDIEASTTFFKTLGLPLNEALTDENATCFNLTDIIVIVLLDRSHFEDILSGNKVADATTTNEMLLAIAAENRQEVDDLATKAVKAGGRELHDPMEAGNVYGRTFADLDGHRWNVFYMSES